MTLAATDRQADLNSSERDGAYTSVDASLLCDLLSREAAPSVDGHGIAVVRPYIRGRMPWT